MYLSQKNIDRSYLFAESMFFVFVCSTIFDVDYSYVDMISSIDFAWSGLLNL